MSNFFATNGTPVSAGVDSLNSMTGALSLVAGANITITPGGGTLTISTTAGAFANESLSNLTSPTAINQNLIFDSSLTDPTLQSAHTLHLIGGNGVIVDATLVEVSNGAGQATLQVLGGAGVGEGGQLILGGTTGHLTQLRAPDSGYTGVFTLPPDAGSAGSMLYSDGSGTMRFSSNNLSWDNTNKRLTVGAASSAGNTPVRGTIYAATTDANGTIFSEYVGNTNAGASYHMRRALGTPGTPLTLTNNQNIGSVFGQGWDGTGSYSAAVGGMQIFASPSGASWSNTDHGAYLYLSATQPGTTTRHNVIGLSISSTGKATLGFQGSNQTSAFGMVWDGTTTFQNVWPATQGTNRSIFTQDGSGNLAWSTVVGDVTSTVAQGNFTVVGLKGIPIVLTSLTSGDTLSYNGTSWVNTASGGSFADVNLSNLSSTAISVDLSTTDSTQNLGNGSHYWANIFVNNIHSGSGNDITFSPSTGNVNFQDSNVFGIANLGLRAGGQTTTLVGGGGTVTFTLPAADGSANAALITNGAGHLSFQTGFTGTVSPVTSITVVNGIVTAVS